MYFLCPVAASRTSVLLPQPGSLSLSLTPLTAPWPRSFCLTLSENFTLTLISRDSDRWGRPQSLGLTAPLPVGLSPHPHPIRPCSWSPPDPCCPVPAVTSLSLASRASGPSCPLTSVLPYFRHPLLSALPSVPAGDVCTREPWSSYP